MNQLVYNTYNGLPCVLIVPGHSQLALHCLVRFSHFGLTFESHPSSTSLYPQMAGWRNVRFTVALRVFQERGHRVMVRVGVTILGTRSFT